MIFEPFSPDGITAADHCWRETKTGLEVYVSDMTREQSAAWLDEHDGWIRALRAVASYEMTPLMAISIGPRGMTAHFETRARAAVRR